MKTHKTLFLALFYFIFFTQYFGSCKITFAAETSKISDATIKKKEAALGNAYGTGTFVTDLSKEDQEIGAVIEKMTQQKKSQKKIDKKVLKIQKKYEKKRSKAAHRRKKEGEKAADQLYISQVRSEEAQFKGSSSLLEYSRYKLLKSMDRSPVTDFFLPITDLFVPRTRNFDQLEAIEENSQRVYSLLEPKYRKLLDANESLSKIVRAQADGVLPDKNLLDIRSNRKKQKAIRKDIRELEKSISLKMVSDPKKIELSQEFNLDRTFIKKESRLLSKQAKRSISGISKIKKSVYHERYLELEKRVQAEIEDPQTKPLKAKILRVQWWILQSYSVEAELGLGRDDFYKQVDDFEYNLGWRFSAASTGYMYLESEIQKTKALFPEKSSSLDWDKLELDDKVVISQVEILLHAFNVARQSKSRLYYENNGEIRRHCGPFSCVSKSSHTYHGDYKATQAEARRLLNSYSKSHRNLVLVKLAKDAGKALIGVPVGAVIAVPGAIAYGAWKWGIQPAYSHLDSYLTVRKEGSSRLNEFEAQLDAEIQNPETTPLHSYLLVKALKAAKRESRFPYLLGEADMKLIAEKVKNAEMVLNAQYSELEKTMDVILSASEDKLVKWNSEWISKEQMKKFIRNLKAVKKARRKFAKIPLSQSTAEYHGDFRRTEENAKALVDAFQSYEISNKLSDLVVSLANITKATGHLIAAPIRNPLDRIKGAMELRTSQNVLRKWVKNEYKTSTPLRRSVLKYQLKKAFRTEPGFVELEQLNADVTRAVEVSSHLYEQLDQQLDEVSNLQGDIRFDAITDERIEKWKSSQNAARDARRGKLFPDLEVQGMTYPGDYKATQNRLKFILSQVEQSQNGKVLSWFKSAVTSPARGVRAVKDFGKKCVEDLRIVKILGLKGHRGYNSANWTHLASGDTVKLLEESYVRSVEKLVQGDVGRVLSASDVRAKAQVLANLFIEKSTPLRAQLREIKASTGEGESLQKQAHEVVLTRHILQVFSNPENYQFSPEELEVIGQQVEYYLNQIEMRKQLQALIHEATQKVTELETDPTRPNWILLSFQEFRQRKKVLEDGPAPARVARVYVKQLKKQIRRTQFLIDTMSPINPNDLDFMAAAQKNTEKKLYKRESKVRKKEWKKNEKFWRREEFRKYESAVQMKILDHTIADLQEGVLPENSNISRIENFAREYRPLEGEPVLSYPALCRATDALDRGKWQFEKWDAKNNYERTPKEVARQTGIEALTAYCDFIRSQDPADQAAHELLESEDLKSDKKKNGKSPASEIPGDSHEKSKTTFLKNYVALAEFPNVETVDRMEECLVCFEPVAYQFRALSEIHPSIPPEYDRLVQVPANGDAHRLTSCGHLIHKSCLLGMEVSRGLAIYKCPKCPEPIPYYELNQEKRIEVQGMSWDHP